MLFLHNQCLYIFNVSYLIILKIVIGSDGCRRTYKITALIENIIVILAIAGDFTPLGEIFDSYNKLLVLIENK